ncbi:MAG: bifunctional oligoribonuclease/PAP phosphatase NrnA [Patescibacteria group bacterium]|jgi:phosphoesterase RecJ-like protein
MFSPDLSKSLKDIIANSPRVLLICHEKPDGDAISSLLATRLMLFGLNCLDVQMVSIDGVPKAFEFLPDSNLIKSDFLRGDFEVIITLDCGDFKRTGYSDRIAKMIEKGTKLINIDHHPKNDIFRIAHLNLSDTTCASTTQIIYQLCQFFHLKLDVKLATLLFVGLYTDTGGFQHIVTSPEVMRMAAELVSSGAQTRLISQYLTGTKSSAQLKLWGRVISRARVSKDGVVVAGVTQSDLKAVGANEEDVAGLLTMLETLDQCKMAILLCETADGVIKGSLRSNNSQIDVSKIARYFGGGGHVKAAGFTLPGKLVIDKHSVSVV